MTEKKIVIIEDDEEFAEMLQQALESYGYEVKIFTSAIFTQFLNKEKPHLLLVDVWFAQEHTGIDMVKAANMHHSLANVPVILMSSDMDLPHYAAEVNATSFLQKPFSFDSLIEQVNDILTTAPYPQIIN